MSEWIGELFCKGVTRKAIFWKNVRNKVRLLFGIFQFEFGTPKSASRTEEGTQGEYVCKALAVTLLTLLSCNVVAGSIVRYNFNMFLYKTEICNQYNQHAPTYSNKELIFLHVVYSILMFDIHMHVIVIYASIYSREVIYLLHIGGYMLAIYKTYMWL